MTDLRFPVEVIGGVPVVRLPEAIDITNAEGLRSALAQAAWHGSTLVVDMARTQFCDSAGLHAVVAAHKRAQAKGHQVLLVMGGAAVLRIFAITGLDSVIPHFASVDQALTHAAAGPAQESGDTPGH